VTRPHAAGCQFCQDTRPARVIAGIAYWICGKAKTLAAPKALPINPKNFPAGESYRKGEKKRPLKETRSCDECHKPYHPISGNQKYCSPCSMVVLKRQRRASSVRWKERKKG